MDVEGKLYFSLWLVFIGNMTFSLSSTLFEVQVRAIVVLAMHIAHRYNGKLYLAIYEHIITNHY